jgi:tetratricopeptide (TPR) repeat protein
MPLLAVAAFWPAAGLGFTGFDDVAYVLNNLHVVELDGLWRIWSSTDTPQYYPLTFSTFWLEYRLWGPDPTGYHITNILLHALNAWLVAMVLRALGCRPWVTLSVAALFAVHPVQVMSVAWIAQRKNLLSALFALLAVLAWLRARPGRSGRPWTLLTGLLFSCAVLSKTHVATLTVTLLMLDAAVLGTPLRRCLFRQIPFISIGVVAAVVTASVEASYIAHRPEWVERGVIAGAALWFYAGQLVAPFDLAPVYPRWTVDASCWAWWLPLGAMIALIAVILKMRKRIPVVVRLGGVHFIATLLPVVGIVAYGNMAITYVSDHYLYLACPGFFLVVLGIAPRWVTTNRQRILVWSCGVVVTIACVAATMRYIPTFNSAVAIWQRTLAVNPQSYVAHAGLAQTHAVAGRIALALKHLDVAVALEPAEWALRVDIGKILLNDGHLDDARGVLEDFSRAWPALAEPWSSLGRVAVRQRRFADARGHFETALHRDPRHIETHLELGKLGLGLMDRALAGRHFQAVITLAPERPDGHLGLATVLRGQNDPHGAAATLENGLRHIDDDVRLLNLLARIKATAPQAEVRSGAEAVRLSQRAIALTRPSAQLLETLAAAWAETGQYDNAVATIDRATVLARSASDFNILSVLQARRQLYLSGHPLREPSAEHGER